MVEEGKSPLDEDQVVQELRDLLIRSEPVPADVAAEVEAGIRSEAEKLRTVSWTEITALACLVFLLGGIAVTSSPTLPLLAVCTLASGLYALGERWVLQGTEA